ncbi:hypothetical protein [Planctomycetes bacterium K23_9]|uniref:NADH dehydrogenase subunit E n=1 Tax=Stieleria marina TaxID=1930275 RepID=A0A517NTD2_9BACT|nr:NADH dehydrogenase subunit E [Planctomycetes bacterium K23_9]
MFQLSSLLAYSDLGLLLAVIGVYVFFAALWLVYVTTERSAKGTIETEKRIERLRHETIQEIANARALQHQSAATVAPHMAGEAIADVSNQLRSEVTTVRDIAMMNANKLAELAAANAALMEKIEAHTSLLDAHVEEFHVEETLDDNVVESFEVDTESMIDEPEPAAPVFKLFSPSDESELEEISVNDDLSAHDPELGLVYYQRPETPDDLTRIWGVGATNQDLLNENGVFFFHQVAAWTESHIAKFNDILCFRGRIEREDWVGQAKRLSTSGTSTHRDAA